MCAAFSRAVEDLRARVVQVSKEHNVPVAEVLHLLGAVPLHSAPGPVSAFSDPITDSADESSVHLTNQSLRHSSNSSVTSAGQIQELQGPLPSGGSLASGFGAGSSFAAADDGGAASGSQHGRRGRHLRYRSRVMSGAGDSFQPPAQGTTTGGRLSPVQSAPTVSSGGGAPIHAPGRDTVLAASVLAGEGGFRNSHDVLDASFSRSTNRSIIAIDRQSGHAMRVQEVEEDPSDIDDDVRRPTLSTQDIRNFNRQASNPTYSVVPNMTFGVEIETLIAKRSDEFLTENSVKAIRDVVPLLMSTLGADYKFKFFEYNDAKADREYSVWKITTDLSIKPEDGRPIFGLEFVSPKLVGNSGLKRLENVCDALQRAGCATNNTTALHVHVSCESMSNERIRRFSSYAIFFESVIDQFMTLPRRADYSKYCRSNLKSVSMARLSVEAAKLVEAVDVSSSLDKLIAIMCPRLSNVKNSQRNHKINYMLLKGTSVGTPGRRLEFRQHQGTCDKHEVAAWTAFLGKYLMRASAMTITPWEFEKGGTPTFEKLWELIDDDDLKLFFTVKKETLPTRFDFTYDSREMFAFESDDEGDLASSSAWQQPTPNSAAATAQPSPPTTNTNLAPHAPGNAMPAGVSPRPQPQSSSSLSLPLAPSTSRGHAPGAALPEPLLSHVPAAESAAATADSVGVSPEGSVLSPLGSQQRNSGSDSGGIGSTMLISSINRNSSLEQSTFMVGISAQVAVAQLFASGATLGGVSGPSALGSSGGAGARGKGPLSLWDCDLSSVRQFKAPLPIALAVEFYVEDVAADDVHSAITQSPNATMVNVHPSTDPGSRKSSSEWAVSSPAVEHAKFVRRRPGVRVATPSSTELRSFAFFSDCLHAGGPAFTVDAEGAVFYSIDLTRASAAKRRRVLECIVIHEEPLAAMLGGEAIPLTESIFENLERRKHTCVEALKWIRSECGGTSNTAAKDLPAEFCKAVNPPDVRAEEDRPFRVTLAEKSRVFVLRGSVAPAQRMLMRCFFLAYFAARAIAMSDDEISNDGQAAAMYGPIKLDTLKHKLDNTPECIKALA